MQEKRNTDVMKIRDAVIWARENGIDLSEYTLRRAIRSGQLPCRIIGRTYLISWQNLVDWATCSGSCDNPMGINGSDVKSAN